MSIRGCEEVDAEVRSAADSLEADVISVRHDGAKNAASFVIVKRKHAIRDILENKKLLQ